MATEPGPASVVALGASSAGVVVWRVKGQLRLTVVVKASFDLVPGGPMTPAAPEDIVTAEVHHRNAPTQSVRLTGDLAPFLPAADALLVGHAHAPEGAPAQALTVRFAVFREQALVEKLVHVYGDRKASAGEVTPFEQMPLVYERAYGGLGNKDNPFGTGVGANDKAPNLVDPADPKKPACFAPISASWPSRKRMLDRAQQEGLKQPVIEIVGDLSWQYFHAAPPDQRIPQYLRGNEWVVLDGLHPTQRSVHSRLPDAAAAVRVYGLGESDGKELALVADTLRIDADRMVCSLVWRGHVPVPDEATLASLEVVAGVGLGGQAIEWPSRLEDEVLVEFDSLSGASDLPAVTVTPAHPELPQPPAPGASFVGTLTVTIEEEQLAAGRRPLPFVPGKAEIPASPPRPPPDSTGPSGETLAIPVGQAASLRTLPFAAEASPPPPRPSPFAMGLQPAAPIEEPSPAAPTFLKKTPRTLQGLAAIAPPHPEPAMPVVPRRKPARTTLGIELFPDGPLAIEVVPWGLTPARDTLAVIVKATCDLAPKGPAVPRPQADPPVGEATAGPPPRCVYPSDLVPYKVRADVVLVGHAHAPGGSATSMEVSFRFGAGDNRFARRVLVFGDRRWQKTKGALQPSAPEPFGRMAVAFDRAFGGPRFGANPAGLGHHDPMRPGPVPLPNLEDPEELLRSPRQSPPPAVFAPIPLAWKDRWSAARESGLCLADVLDWARFQAAPAAQQLAFLRGDEPFAIAGLSARHPSIEGALPGICGRAFAVREGDRFEEVALRLDTVVIDADAMKLDLVWRGALPVVDELSPDVTGIYALADKLGAETPLGEARVKVLRP